MLARCATYVLDGIEARRVTVECDVRPGLPSFTIVGLPDSGARELRETVRAAVQNSGYEFPQCRVTINIAPAWLRSASRSVSLAVAVAVLAASAQIPAERVADIAVYGDLTLGGELRQLPGTLAAVRAHRSSAAAAPFLYAGAPIPLAASPSAPVANLRDIPAPNPARALPPVPVSARTSPDFADIRGHAHAIFALTVAAVGGHHVLLRGAPGSGATMLARRLVSILPDLSDAEKLEVATIRDAAGLGREGERPFRAPHHTISAAGLVGGGSPPRPGEISLAHRGVLYLQDLGEFQRSTLDALRQPIDDQSVAIVRGSRAYRFPASFQLVAAASPCPCGYANTDRCVCDSRALARHWRRVSGSLLDRFAILVDLPDHADLRGAPAAQSSAELRDRVLAARERRVVRNAAARQQHRSSRARPLADLTLAAEDALERACRAGTLTLRSCHQVVQVARTVADLAGETAIAADSLNTALGLRGLGSYATARGLLCLPDPREAGVAER